MGEQVKDKRRQRLCSLSSARRGVHRFVDSEWVFVGQNESARLSQAAMSWTKDMALGKVVCVSERAGGKNVLGMRHEIKPAHTFQLRISIRLHSQPPRSSFFHLRPVLCAPYEYRTVCRMPTKHDEQRARKVVVGDCDR